METTINQTTVNTLETTTSSLAVYECNVTRVNNILKKITASIYSELSHTNNEGVVEISTQNIGIINYIDGKISCAGFSLDEKLPMYMTEFIEIVSQIKER